MSEDLLALAARVQTAAGADREVDCLIWATLVHDGYEWIPDASGGKGAMLYLPKCKLRLGVTDPGEHSRNFTCWHSTVPAYTSDLNAAMSLLVDDDYYAMLSIERDLREGPQWTARLDSHGDECGNGDSIICTAATQALAITALALKLRAVK